MRSPEPKPYRWLAEYYDRVFTLQHPWVAAAHKAVLGSILPKVESACDLACGTGTTARNLARRGIRMFAVDLSPAMCRVARQRAREAKLPVHVQRADMRSFRLSRPVDLVLCEFDALNHVPRKSDLSRVAAAVARALRPGGFFFFDVNNRLGFEVFWKGTFWIEKPGIVLAMNNGNDASHDRAWTVCEWFVQEGRFWRRHTERVQEVCWSRAEITKTLRSAGFDQVKGWDSTPFFKQGNPVIKPGCRTHYLARKAPEKRRREGHSGTAFLANPTQPRSHRPAAQR